MNLYSFLLFQSTVNSLYKLIWGLTLKEQISAQQTQQTPTEVMMERKPAAHGLYLFSSQV